jgi:hypothetical protein
MKKMDAKSVISTIERWFKERCDGMWEHRFSITIETTDNPGWLLTFGELRLANETVADIAGDLLREYAAQVATDGTMVRVFAPSLQQVLTAAAVLSTLTGQNKGDIIDGLTRKGNATVVRERDAD